MKQILSSFPGGKRASHGAYVWKQLTAEDGEFLAFVVDENESAYPDGGMQDGKWYELFKGVDISLLECSMYAVDTITVSTDTKIISADFVHSLNDFPKFVMIRAEEDIKSEEYVKAIAICFGDMHNNPYNTDYTKVYGYGGVEYYGSESNPGAVEYIYCDATVSAIDVTGGEGYNYKLKAGVLYTIITAA